MKRHPVALCGVLIALAVVAMLLCGAIGIGTYAGPILAMVVLLPVLEEYGVRFSLAAYLVTALAGFLLIPEPELALVFAAFGWYPALRPRMEHIVSPLLRLLLKVALCNLVIVVLYGIVLRLTGLTTDIADAPPILTLTLSVMGTVVFLLTDRALGRMTLLWRQRLRKRLLH